MAMINLLNCTIGRIILFCEVSLFLAGFLWKRQIENEKEFSKRINRKFQLKYLILSMFVVSLLSVISSVFIVLRFAEKGIYLFFGTYIFIFVLMGWIFIYYRTDIHTHIPQNEIMEQYISFFTENKISNIKYLEVILWFSNWYYKYFWHKKDNEKEVNQIYADLELCLKPDDEGLCLACSYKTQFKNICESLKDSKYRVELEKLRLESTDEMKKKPQRISRFYSWILDCNILCYLVIIFLHIAAIILLYYKDIRIIFGNLLLYIPSDILLIFTYKGIIKDKEKI